MTTGGRIRLAPANRWAKDDPGKGISQQMFWILPKIKEVDDFMTSERQGRIREAHPEMTFLRLNGYRALAKKRCNEGQKRRRDLVAASGFTNVDKWLGALPSRVKVDDMLDACACAIAARHAFEGQRNCVPDRPGTDARGLRMEIWF